MNLYTFIGLWLSVVVLPKTPVPPDPNPELVPNKLIVSYSEIAVEKTAMVKALKPKERLNKN